MKNLLINFDVKMIDDSKIVGGVQKVANHQIILDPITFNRIIESIAAKLTETKELNALEDITIAVQNAFEK